jgi:histidine triad (HIT) family protein
MDCVFCKIAAKEMSADIVLESERAIAFRDIHPKAPVHLLVIPKEHRPSLAETTDADAALLGELLRFARVVAEKAGIAKTGYKLVMNVGRGAGQIVDHLHLHLLGGWEGRPARADV